MSDNASREKIAILGGGVGAMTAAYELAVQDKYDITVYQSGWRLGGQGASGRNADNHQRIEEHGLHVWFGFYVNAFSLMRRCYTDLGRSAGVPLATVEEAYVGQDVFMFRETLPDNSVHPWRITFLSDPSVFPGHDPRTGGAAPELPDLKEVVRLLLVNTAYHAAGGSVMPPVTATSPWFAAIEQRIEAFESAAHVAAASEWRRAFHELIEALDATDADPWNALADQLRMLRTAIRDVLRPWQHFDLPRRTWHIVDLMLTTCIGMLADGVLIHGCDAINGQDFRAWMQKHDADPVVVEGPLIRALYDVFFGYEGGDTDQPNVEAGPALRGSLRTFLTYHGHVLWKMKAGMGDVVFAPLYQVLRDKYNVKFEFFHRVERLEFDEGSRRISSIQIARQVDLKGPTYDPLVVVDQLPCWPNAPLADQIVNGAALKGIDIDSPFTAWQDAGQVTLRDGVDFDHVVLGISIGVLPFICDEKLLALEPWRNMLDAVKTVRTQAVQLWFNRTATDLGEAVPGSIMADCTEALSCWADFIQVLDREQWTGPGAAQALFYGCGVLKDGASEYPPFTDHGFPARELARVRDLVSGFLQAHGVQVWAKAVTGTALDWTALVAPDDVTGPARLDYQYLRANVDPAERYVMSPSGSTRFRLKADASGVANLVLAGGWIDNGLNLGCVEAAVMSGMQAARAISGLPRGIYGESGFLPPGT